MGYNLAGVMGWCPKGWVMGWGRMGWVRSGDSDGVGSDGVGVMPDCGEELRDAHAQVAMHPVSDHLAAVVVQLTI